MVDFTKLFPIQEQAESGGNPLAVSSAGAIGPMQTMPGTLKSPGYGVAAAKDNSIEEQRRVGQDYMKAMVAEYGNLNDALVAYNWGPGNANKWKASGSDPAKLPKETRDYVAKIAAQMGGEPIVAGAGRGAVNPPMANQPTRNVKDDIEAALNKTYQAQVYGKPSTEADFQRGVDEFMKKQSAEIAMEPTQLEAFGAAVAGSPIHSIYKNMTRPRYEPEPGFVPDMAKLPADADTTLVEHFRTARSTAETDEALRHWNDEQLRIRTLSSGGVGNALLRSLGAEIIDPLNILMPWAAAKGLARMGAGSIEAFKAGRVAKGYGTAVLENLVSGTAIEAVKQSVEGEFRPADLGISLVADSLLGIGMGALTHHSVARSLIDNAAVVTLAREADLIARAAKKLGPTATVEELRKEADNLRKGDVEKIIRDGLGDVAPENKIIPGELTTTERSSVDVSEAKIEGQPTVTTTTTTDTTTRLEFPPSTIPTPQTPEFQSFIAGTKVVDETGAPKIMYHGTSSNEAGDAFTAFRTDDSNYGLFGRGAYFTDNPTTAASYTRKGGGDTKHVYATYLSIKNPIDMDGPANAEAWEKVLPGVTANAIAPTNEAFFRAAEKMLGVSERQGGGMEITNLIKAMGHDGITHVGGGRVNKNGRRHQVYIAFEKGQIKSAVGNRGTFDPANPRMDMQLSEATRFADPANPAAVREANASGGRYEDLQAIGLGLPKGASPEVARGALEALDSTPGVHLPANLARNADYKKLAASLEGLRKQMLPDVAIHLTDGGTYLKAKKANGVHGMLREGVSVIAIDPRANVSTLVHEFGHAVFAHRLSKLPQAQQDALHDAWQKWKKSFTIEGKAQESMMGRSPIGPSLIPTREGKQSQASIAIRGEYKGFLADIWDKVFPNQSEADAYARYFANFDEFSAEQLNKFVEAEAAGLGQGNLSLSAQIFQAFTGLIRTAAELFGLAKKQNLVRADENFEKFFNDLIVGNKAEGKPALSLPKPQGSGLQQMVVPAKPAAVVNEMLTDPDFAKYGLTNLPMGTAAQRKEAQAILAIHKKAAVWEQANPMDDAWKKRMANLANNTVFNVASTGLTMLSSPSPVVRMLATQLLEDASGVAGKRGATAAIHKYMVERAMLGNSIPDVQRSYEMWKVGKPGGVMDDMVGGKQWAEFNKQIASEIEARAGAGVAVSQDPHIKAAADSLEAAYQRTANEQRRVDTLGSKGLPASSVGYMPHSMNAQQFITLPQAKQDVVHSALVDQFVSKGWDMSFSDQLASKYLDMARKRAAGDYGTAMGGANAASQVEEALRAMDLPEETITKHMEKFTKGGANFTKGRLELDLNKVYTVDGEDFRLLDIFETDQIELLRSQVGRASGDVALTKFGVRGKPGADLLYNAIQFGEDGKKGGMKELEAYQQVMAEFFNEPYGNSGGKFLERAVLANAWVSMGSAAINQLSEFINGMAHVGFLRSMDAVASMPRLRRELLAKVKGQSIDNPILDSIEIAGGAEFGADGYKYVMPFDSPNNLYPTYGQDTPTLVDRVLRGGGHVQAVLSGHRMLSAVQQRGMAEQIVHKMARYVREGKDDIALDQFGIDANLRAKLRQDINQWATFNGGRLVRFEADKITDPEVREAVIQAVWRGTNQIIQGTFIGERGKWAHDGVLKMMTQFRSFNITSMEKQWGRQRNSRGTFGAMGIVLGAMSLAWPIHVARTYAQSIGRPDQDEFLETRLSGQHVARATMNYVAGLGMLPDLMDMGTQLLPDSWGVNTTGGRMGTETDFIGNYVAPATGLVDNIWKYAQSPLEAEDAMRIMPFSRLPYVIPLLNNARD